MKMDILAKRLGANLKILILTIVIVFLSNVFSGTKSAEGFEYVTYAPSTNNGDCYKHDIPSQTFPNKWGTYIDQVFNTTIRRVTDYVSDYGGEIKPTIQYTTFSGGNSDNTKVCFGYSNTTKPFYDATNGNLIRVKNFGSTNGDIEFRWSHSNPVMGYFRRNMSFYSYNVDTDTVIELHDFSAEFPGASSINNNDKGEQSWDDKYICFRVQYPDDGSGVSYLIVYEIPTDTIIAQLNVREFYKQEFDYDSASMRYATMSPSGNFVIGMGTTVIGTFLFDRNLNYLHLIEDSAIGHPAWGYDINGNEVVYWGGAPHLYMHKLSGPEMNCTTILHFFDDCPHCTSDEYWGSVSGYHFSTCYNIPGWVFVSPYHNETSQTCDAWLDREIFAVRTSENPEEILVWRIVHTRGTADSYNSQSRAQVSQDGKYIYYDSNWLGKQDREIFRAELPENWYQDLANYMPQPDTNPPMPPTGVCILE